MLETFRRRIGVEDATCHETFRHLDAKIGKPSVAQVNRASGIGVVPKTRSHHDGTSRCR